MRGYITFASARKSQADSLEAAIGSIREQVRRYQAAGEFQGPGPIFVGIGGSLAAACAPVWSLRSRGIHAWRLGSGDHPLPFPKSGHPIIGVSQSGRSPETLTVLQSVDDRLRYAVVNNAPSPVSSAADKVLHLGNIPDSYASTIGYTATIAGLGIIADAWDHGTIDAGWDELPILFRELETRLASQAPEVATAFLGAGWADFVGVGSSVGAAESGALLFREVARIPSSAMTTRQYLHGSMESAGGGVHVLFGDDRELAVANTLLQAGHRVVLITSAAAVDTPGLWIIRVPAVAVAQRAILEALVMQSLVGAVAGLLDIAAEDFVFHNADTKVAAESGAVAETQSEPGSEPRVGA